jgi:hypothetical protein
VTIGQCCFEAETADITVGGVSMWTEFGADRRDIKLKLDCFNSVNF